MAGASSTDVARISVRVVPNLKGFREKVKAEASRAARSASGNDVTFEADAKGFTKKTKAAAKRAARGASGEKVGFGISLDTQKLLAEAVAAANAASQNRVNFKARMYSREAQAQALAAARAASGHVIRFKTDVDTDKLKNKVWAAMFDDSSFKMPEIDMSRVKRSLEDLRKMAEKDMLFDVDFDDPYIEAKARQAAKKAAKAASGEKIKFDADTSRLKRAMSRIGQGFRRLGQSLSSIWREADKGTSSIRKLGDETEKSMKKAGRSTSGFFKNLRQKYFQPDSTIGFIVVAIAAILAPAIALIGSLMAGLPTLLASVGAAAAVVALGFEGIKDAAQPLIAALQPLREQLAGTFRETLTPQFEKLASLVPQITPQLDRIARSMTDVTKAFVDTVSMPQNIGLLNSFLGKTAELFTSMAPGMAAFTQGFLTMFDGAASGYPAMAKVFNGFAELFSRDMSSLVSTGQMQAAMEALAVTTGSLMENLHRILVVGVQAMPAVTEGLTAFFTGIGDLFVAGMPALAQFSNFVGTVLGELGSQLGPMFGALAEGMAQVQSAFGPALITVLQAVGPALTELMNGLGQVFGTLGSALGESLAQISPMITELAFAISGALVGAFQALMPFIPTLVSSIASLAAAFAVALAAILNAFGPVINVVITALAALVSAIAVVIGALASLAANNPDIFGPLAVGIFAAVAAFKLVTKAVVMYTAVKKALIAVLAAARAAAIAFSVALSANPIGVVVALIVGLIAALVYFFTQTELGKKAWQGLVNVFKAAIGVIGKVTEGVAAIAGALGFDGLASVADRAAGRMENFSNSTSSASSSAEESSSSFMGMGDTISGITPQIGGFGSALDGATNSALNLAGTSPEIQAALATVSDSAGVASGAVSGIGDAAQSAVDPVQGAIESMNNSFLHVAIPGFTEASNKFHQMGVEMGTNMAGIAMAIPGTFAPFETELLGLGPMAATAASDMTNALGAGLEGFAPVGAQNIVGPIKTELNKLPQEATNATNNMGQALTSGISDASSGVQAGLAPLPGHVTEAGAAMTTEATTAMTNVNTEIQTGVDNARTTASQLVPAVKEGIGPTHGVLNGSGAALVDGFIAGIRSKIGEVSAAAAAVAAAAKANFPNSPAKEGPLSGRGYTTYSGEALVKDFAGGMDGARPYVQDAASRVAGDVQKGLEKYQKAISQYNEDQLVNPILENNAKKIADYRKREAEALERGNDDAEKALERRNKMLESLEVPDFKDINRSIQSYYIDGTKGMFQSALLKQAEDQKFSAQLRGVALQAVSEAREIFGNHPVMAQVEANVNGKYFERSIKEAIEASEIGYVPIEFAISNLDQLQKDLGFGDGVLSRAMQAALEFNPNDTDAHRWGKEKEEVHYHVADMEEAIRLENERRKKNALRYV